MDTYQFDPERALFNLVDGVRALSKEQGFSRVVVGISGGKDSTVTAAVCARALGPENVYGILLPDGEQPDIDDSLRVCEALGIRRRIMNIGEVHRVLREVTDQLSCKAREGEFSIPPSLESDINVGPRLRMTVLRYAAQALGARLAGTGNLSEATVGYCTKDGDTSCDFAVLRRLTSVEVVEVGKRMEELPKDLVVKTPADGLSGQSDEEKMGLSYADIHAFIRLGSCGRPDVDEKIAARKKANRHKQQMPAAIDPFA